MIEIKNLTKSYYSDHAALLDISHSFDSRPMVVIGESGAGKTVLLNILAGIDREYEGQVNIDGVERRSLSLEDANISFITKEPVGLNGKSVFDNLMYVFRVKDKKFDKAKAVLEIKQVAQELEIFGILDKKFKRLNLFEKRLVCVARALLKKSKIVMIDEPFFKLLEFEKASLWQSLLLTTSKLSSGLIVAEKPQNLAYFEGCNILKLSFGTKLE